jgi:Uncharacterized protein conserved in bacteria (DUF2252)
MNIHESTRLYEDWLGMQLKGDVVKSDLARKREKMKEAPFVFLRATYWRWAETILDVCPDLAAAPEVLAIGDSHLENFGTWRDVDGRLAWGVNDFDEAAPMPYALDLVRLAASALLAGGQRHLTAENISARILEGYADGLRNPRPIVLDRDYGWLRENVIVSENARAKFWRKIAEAKQRSAPARYRRALTTAMPEPRLALRIVPRSAGTGSLGRPRWVGIAEWRGAPVVREAKALVKSAWLRVRRGRAGKAYVRAIANGCYRSWDPWFNVDGGIVVRRLSPNNRKIEAENAVEVLLMPEMLRTMGFEIANVHTGVDAPRAEISSDLRMRKREWLAANAKMAAEAVTRDYADWRS